MRVEISGSRKACRNGVNRLNQLMSKKTKKFSPEEVASFADSVAKLSDNIRLVGDLFEDQ